MHKILISRCLLGELVRYDGNFKGVKIEGQGITTTLLRQNGIPVFCEKTLDDALACYQRLEKTLAE